MPRIFDCFPFFNELDLLEIRLHEHSDAVDRFVIAESTTTFSGEPKPLYFQENRERFAAFADRITHIVIRDIPAKWQSRWGREQYQRDVLAQGLGSAAPDDLILICDVDEILRTDVLHAVKASPPSRAEVLCFELRMYNYYVNFETEERLLRSGPRAAYRQTVDEMWSLRMVKGPRPTGKLGIFRSISNWRRMRRPVRTKIIRDAGWHFTFLGGIDDIAEKIRARTGSQSKKAILDPEWLDKRIKAGLESNQRHNRPLSYRPLDETFPRYLLDNRDRFAHLILQSEPSGSVAP